MVHTIQNNADSKKFLGTLIGTKISEFKQIYRGTDLEDIFDVGAPMPDIMLEDTDKNCYVIQYMRDEKFDLEELRRYYQQTVDDYYYHRSRSATDLPEVYIIFICNYDYFGLGLAMYYTEDTFDGIEVVDGRHMIVLNSQYLVSNADPEIIVLLDRIRNYHVNLERNSEQAGE